MSHEFSLVELYTFLKDAGVNTYFGDPVYIEPERPGFKELEYKHGDWHYRDSYTGFTRSRGMDVVRYKEEIVWSSSYGGGVVQGKEDLTGECFAFLKKAMSQKDDSQNVRGPDLFEDSGWKYVYTQHGNIDEFSGNEEIYFKEDLIFFHKIIGGLVKH